MNFLDSGVIDSMKPIGGGWRYLQVHQGKTWRIPAEGSAKTAEALVKAVTAFRVTAGIPLGDPFHDVCDFIIKASPPNDRWKGKVVGRPARREITPLIQDIREWVDRTARAKPRFVYIDDARQRARACMTCNQNIHWMTGGCTSCNEEVEYRSYNLRQSRSAAPEEDALRGCRLHRFHLPSAVHLDQDFLPNRHADAPPACWVPKQDTATL